MKYRNIFNLLFLLAALVACDDEDELYPRSEDVNSVSRFEFPQGDNAWDKDLEEISHTFGIIPIYKGFDTIALNQAWSGVFRMNYYGENLSDEYAEFYTNFIKNHVFAHLKLEYCKGVLPNYLYLVDDLRQKFSGYIGYSPQPCYWNGMDYWAFSFRAKEENLAYRDLGNGVIERLFTPWDLPSTAWESKTFRVRILQNILERIVNKGNIEVLAEFNSSDFDYTKKPVNKPDDANYYLKLGYPGKMRSPIYNFEPIASGTMDAKTNFTCYLKLGLRYTRDSVEILYPKEKYPLIIKYYDLTMKYMKDKYDWDITQAAVLKED